MNDITIFIFGIGFALTAGATFAFMWRSMSFVFKELDKPQKKGASRNEDGTIR